LWSRAPCSDLAGP